MSSRLVVAAAVLAVAASLLLGLYLRGRSDGARGEAGRTAAELAVGRTQALEVRGERAAAERRAEVEALGTRIGLALHRIGALTAEAGALWLREADGTLVPSGRPGYDHFG